MARIFLISMLLVLVYQFDEVVRFLLHVVRRVSRNRISVVIRDSDHYVGTAVTIAVMPLMLYSVMVSERGMLAKLFFLGGIYLGFALLSAGVGYVYRQMRHLSHYEGYTLLFSSIGVVGGLFHPSMNMVPWHASRERLAFAKLAFLLSIPAFLGAAFKLYYRDYQTELSDYLDVLIIVMIGGVFINVTIEALERFFRRVNLGVFGYFRVAAGMLVASYLLFS